MCTSWRGHSDMAVAILSAWHVVGPIRCRVPVVVPILGRLAAHGVCLVVVPKMAGQVRREEHDRHGEPDLRTRAALCTPRSHRAAAAAAAGAGMTCGGNMHVACSACNAWAHQGVPALLQVPLEACGPVQQVMLQPRRHTCRAPTGMTMGPPTPTEPTSNCMPLPFSRRRASRRHTGQPGSALGVLHAITSSSSPPGTPDTSHSSNAGSPAQSG